MDCRAGSSHGRRGAGVLYIFSTLDKHMVIAVTVGVFFSMVLGCGLFAAAFFSDKSGHDASVDNSTRSHRDKQP